MIHLAIVETVEGVITTSQGSATFIAEPQVPSVGEIGNQCKIMLYCREIKKRVQYNSLNIRRLFMHFKIVFDTPFHFEQYTVFILYVTILHI